MAFHHPTLHRFSLLALAGLTAAASCEDPGPDTVVVDEARSQKVRQANPAVDAADRQALSEGNAAFGMALYRQVEEKHPNLVFSPTSISTALAMTFAGARGQTETEMATALRFTLPQARLHPAFNEVSAALATRGAGTQGADGKPFRLNIVNTTWAQKGFTMETPYLDVLAAELRRRRQPARLHPRHRELAPDHQPLGRAADRGPDQGSASPKG